MKYRASELKKVGIALIGAAAEAVSLGLVPPPYDKYGTVVISLATALGVFAAQNVGPVSPRSAEDGQGVL